MLQPVAKKKKKKKKDGLNTKVSLYVDPILEVVV